MGESNLDLKGKRELGDFLYASARRGDWDEVVEEYKKASNVAQSLTLIKDKNTALHLAVIDNQEEIVEKLVKLICRSIDDKILLEAKNERENNPLHLAAALGSARMCQAIASAHEGLVDERNKDGETPIFLAALHGHKDAFYCLYYFCKNYPDRIASNCKANGDTVLHCALRNEQFDLAFQFIDLYKEAMNWVNRQGLTALHVLASKPTSFKSGSNIRGWQNIIYYSTFVEQLKPQPIDTLSKACKKSMSKTSTTASYFPVKYGTCIDFFTRLWDGFLKVSTLKRLVDRKKNDEAKNDTNLEKDVNVESENSCIDESHERVDSGSFTDRQLAEESSTKNFSKSYNTCMDIFKVVISAIMIILEFGFPKFRKIREKKEKHTWSVQVMEKLLEFAEADKYSHDGRTPMASTSQTEEPDTLPYVFVGDEVNFSHENLDGKLNDSKNPEEVIETETETAMLLAAKNGVIEIVTRLFERLPLAIWDTRKDKKNVVHLAAEYRQPDVYRFLLKKKERIKRQFREVDDKGNSALHLAATASDPGLWSISGVALQIQWEVKWYKYVRNSMPLHVFAKYNNEGKTANTIFHETHMTLMEESGKWLTKTSKSCSVVGTLIVTVAFTSAVSIPGGFDDRDGTPLLEKQLAFLIFAVFSLIALCLSSTSVIMFLSIMTYRFDAPDFKSNWLWKLFVGFSSLFFSIISMLVSFCAGHYFLIDHRLQNVAVLLYTLVFFPVVFFFLVSKLPLYIDMLRTIFEIIPRRSADVVLPDPLADQNPSKPFQKGKCEVTSIPFEVTSISKPILIFTPITQGSYPVILFLPGCIQSDYANFLQLIASHGFVIVAPRPQFNVMATTCKMNKTELTSQVKTWLSSDREGVEDKLSKLPKVKGGKPDVSLALGHDRPSNPFSAVIGFDPVPGTKFSIPESQIQTYVDPQSSNISSSIVESQFVISKLCGTVKLLVSKKSS